MKPGCIQLRPAGSVTCRREWIGTQRQGSKILRWVVDMKKVSEVLMGKSVKGVKG